MLILEIVLTKLTYLDNRFHLGNTENTTTEPETKAATVLQTVRLKKGGAVKYRVYGQVL
jgi:hypothetical protein